ncbi:MAG: NINE protein [Intrasporangium sp.]|uniref:NINE protein n=1 Tax=Intrasporangium sp. TaxID=1925024 RepID=UPI003F7D4C65
MTTPYRPESPDNPPAGWYPDPYGQPMTRYWDGNMWTDHTGPVAAPTLSQAMATQTLVDPYGNPVSTKSRLATALLCLFLGVLGVHRFYVGKIGTGVIQLLTGGGLGIWYLVDLVLIIIGRFRDRDTRLLINW